MRAKMIIPESEVREFLATDYGIDDDDLGVGVMALLMEAFDEHLQSDAARQCVMGFIPMFLVERGVLKKHPVTGQFFKE